MKEGFSKTRLSVLKLNHLVTEAFVKCEIRAIGVPGCGIWQYELEGFEAENMAVHVVDCIDKGFVPICHGDAIFDSSQGCRILSGDIIIKRLCAELSVNRVVFLSDVQGIYNKPPNEDGAFLIPEICAKHDGNVDIPICTSVLKEDVTGGIRLKLDSACEILRNSKGDTTVFICGVSSQGAFNACVTGNLNGEMGTKIVLRDA